VIGGAFISTPQGTSGQSIEIRRAQTTPRSRPARFCAAPSSRRRKAAGNRVTACCRSFSTPATSPAISDEDRDAGWQYHPMQVQCSLRFCRFRCGQSVLRCRCAERVCASPLVLNLGSAPPSIRKAAPRRPIHGTAILVSIDHRRSDRSRDDPLSALPCRASRNHRNRPLVIHSGITWRHAG